MRRTVSALVVVLAAILPALAQQPRSQQGLHLVGWGPRVGVASDPDQIVGGVQFDLGEIVPNLRFVPNAEIGLGDDHTILSVTAPVHYRFRVDAPLTPYVGGGLVVGFVDRDLPEPVRDDRSIEIGAKAIGGVEWRLRGGARFALELDLHASDVYDAQVMTSWTF